LINSYAEDGFQPLGLAAFFGHLEVVTFLLKAGAWVNTASKNELHVTPLASAVAGGYLTIAYRLLDAGADPNIAQAGGIMPLHSAAASGNLEMIRMLLEFGASLHAVSENGKKPVDLAVENGHELAEKLLRSGITKRFRRVPASG
jgi:ankyrin repeat protein